MAAVPYAQAVAKMLQGKHPKGTRIELAPNPKDIVRVISIVCCNRKTQNLSIDLGQHEQD
jgi:hypothetical protein